MGEFFLELIFDFTTELVFSPQFAKKMPKPIRFIAGILTIVFLAALHGLMLFAGLFALFKYCMEGGSILLLIGGIILLIAFSGSITYIIRKNSSKKQINN